MESEQVQIPEDPEEALRLAHDSALAIPTTVHLCGNLTIEFADEIKRAVDTNDDDALKEAELCFYDPFSDLAHHCIRLAALLGNREVDYFLTLGAKPLYSTNPELYGRSVHGHSHALEIASEIASVPHLYLGSCPSWGEKLRVETEGIAPAMAVQPEARQTTLDDFENRAKFMSFFLDSVNALVRKFRLSDQDKPLAPLLRREYRNALNKLNERTATRHRSNSQAGVPQAQKDAVDWGSTASNRIVDETSIARAADARIAPEGFYSAPQLVGMFNIQLTSKNNLEQALRRWRKANLLGTDFIEHDAPGRNTPKFFYRLSAIRDLVSRYEPKS